MLRNFLRLAKSASNVAPSRSFHVSKFAGLMAPARVQMPAPDFSGTAVDNGQFKQIKLSDYSGKWLIMLFYPLDFTFVCPTELVKFSNKIDEVSLSCFLFNIFS